MFVHRSGPLLDRIDLQVEIFPVPFEELASAREGEKSEAIKRRVICAREIQALRFAAERGIHSNAQMNSRLLRTYASIDSDSLETLREAMTRLDMSARAYDRILKVARTIADLEQATAILSAGGCAPTAETLREAITAPIRTHHLSEALSYRNLDRGNWGQTVSKLPKTLTPAKISSPPRTSVLEPSNQRPNDSGLLLA